MPTKLISAALLLSAMVLAAPASAADGKDKAHVFPNLTWQDSEDKSHTLSDYREKPKILHFWAAWCSPCVQEMPHLIEWRKRNPEIRVLALSIDDRIAQTKNFIKKHNFDMQALLLSEESQDELDVPVLPYTIIVDKDNNYLHHFSGMGPWQDAKFSKAIRVLVQVDSTQ